MRHLDFGLSSEAHPLATPTAMTRDGLGGSVGHADPATCLSPGFAPNVWDAAFAAAAESRRDPRTARFEEASKVIDRG